VTDKSTTKREEQERERYRELAIPYAKAKEQLKPDNYRRLKLEVLDRISLILSKATIETRDNIHDAAVLCVGRMQEAKDALDAPQRIIDEYEGLRAKFEKKHESKKKAIEMRGTGDFSPEG
jgi:hypothetical protein